MRFLRTPILALVFALAACTAPAEPHGSGDSSTGEEPPAPVSCSDGLKNGAETDIDCGGGACPACAAGNLCEAASDCLSDRCSGGICQSGGGGESVAEVDSCALPVDAGAAGVKETLGQTFTSTGLTLDVARPLEDGVYPAVVLLHSGGWIAGDKQARRSDARALASKGYVVLNVDYRLAPATHSPGQQSDARCAVRWARANAATYGIDAGRVYALGLSSGGQLAESLGADGELDLDDGTCTIDGDHRVQKVAAWYGIPDLRSNAVVGAGALASVEQYLGCQPDACPAPAALASPIAHLDALDAPVLLSHGTADTTVPYAQATAYRDAVRAAGLNATLVTHAGGDHGYSLFGANAHVPSSCTLLAFFSAP